MKQKMTPAKKYPEARIAAEKLCECGHLGGEHAYTESQDARIELKGADAVGPDGHGDCLEPDCDCDRPAYYDKEEAATPATPAAKPSPLPWATTGKINGETHAHAVVSRTGFVVARVGGDLMAYTEKQKEANAALIVRAVNSHQAMVDALRAVVQHGAWAQSIGNLDLANDLRKAAAALALAQEGK